MSSPGGLPYGPLSPEVLPHGEEGAAVESAARRARRGRDSPTNHHEGGKVSLPRWWHEPLDSQPRRPARWESGGEVPDESFGLLPSGPHIPLGIVAN